MFGSEDNNIYIQRDKCQCKCEVIYHNIPKKKRKIYLQNKNSTMYRLLTWVYINFIVPNKSCFINTDAKRRMRVCLFCSREYGLAIMIKTYLAVKGHFFFSSKGMGCMLILLLEAMQSQGVRTIWRIMTIDDLSCS